LPTCVQQARNTRVIESREERSFLREASFETLSIAIVPQKLDRSLCVVESVSALGEPYLTHAAGSNDMAQSPSAANFTVKVSGTLRCALSSKRAMQKIVKTALCER
jgi:hypothetical protein